MVVLTSGCFHDELIGEFRVIAVENCAPHVTEDGKRIAVCIRQVHNGIRQRRSAFILETVVG